MADPVQSAPWGWRAAFVGLFALLVFVRILPVGSFGGGWPAPDLLMCLCCAWVLRRPDYLPAPLLAAVILTEDLLLMRPPGLWTAFMLLGTEFLRSRAAFARELSFLAEWMMVAVVMGAMLAGYHLVLGVTMVPQATAGPVLVLGIGSVIAYPAVVAATVFAFGLRKPATGEVDALGRRL